MSGRVGRIASGARAVTGGQRRGTGGLLFEPRCSRTTPEMKVRPKRSSAPSLSPPFEGDDIELLARANRTNYGLAAGIWTRDVARASRGGLRRVWSGSTATTSSIQVFFGGYKEWAEDARGRWLIDNTFRRSRSWCRSRGSSRLVQS